MCLSRLLAAYLDFTDIQNLIDRDIVRRFASLLAARGRRALLANYCPTGGLRGARYDSPCGPFEAGSDS